MSSLERLSAEDRLILWPDEVWPQDIGAVGVLDGSSLLDSDGRFRIEAAKQAIEGRLHLLPRFRQVLYATRGAASAARCGSMRPRSTWTITSTSSDWMPRPTRRSSCGPLPGCDGAALDRSRPLWEMWFLTGLPDDRIGWFVRLHHVVADGIAGVAELDVLLDAAPDSASGTSTAMGSSAVAVGTCTAPGQPPAPDRQAEAEP